MSSHPKRVLIVEDDAILALEWKQEIECSLGWETDVAPNSVAAMPLLENREFDIYILDLFYLKNGTFEPIGGIRLIPVINKKVGIGRPIPIIAVTGHFYDDPKVSTRNVLESLGVQHVLQKPVESKELLRLLEELQPNDTEG